MRPPDSALDFPAIPLLGSRGMLLYETIAETIAHQIVKGSFAFGDRLPSLRRVSVQHRVSVATAAHAYVALEQRGLVEGRPKSGFFVRAPRWSAGAELQTSRPTPRPRAVSMGDLRAHIFELSADPAILPLGAATPSMELLPVAKLNRLVGAAARQAGGAAVAYAPLTGIPSLRRQLARRALEWRCRLAPDDFIVTAGASEALLLALRAAVKAGEIVALESPTYFGVLQLVESLGLRALEVPTHPRLGMDMDGLEHLLRTQPVKAVLSIPSFGNPLGACMPESHRRRLVELVTAKRIPLIEDDIYGDLALPSLPRPPAAKSFDTDGWVMLCSSISKTVAPGWRVGWIAPGPRYFDAVRRLKSASTLATASIPQLALAAFLREGGYDRHLRGLRRHYAQQVARMAHAVAESFPEGCRVSRPDGGFVLWIELPRSVDSVELHGRALAAGISVAPGPLFSAQPGRYQNFIRLNCGHPWSDRVQQGLEVLGRLVGRLGRPN
jgi:DNA-binding transcriptional MocR family regulator